MQEYVEIGRILRPRGLKGDLWIEPFSDDPQRLLEIRRFFLESSEGRRELRLKSGSFSKGLLALRFEDVDDRDAAEALLGRCVSIHRDDLPELGKREYFLADLLGLEARLEDGRLVGTVEDLLEQPAAHVFVIRRGEFEALVPSVAEFVLRVDLKRGLVVIRPIEGMLPEGMLET